MKAIGIIGAGVMGIGVSQALAQSGFHIVLVDLSEDILKKAEDEIAKNIRLYTLFRKTDNITNTDETLSNISYTTDMDQLKDADFIIENATEDWDVKKKLYERLNHICSDSCNILVNTSCISITKIAALYNYPQKIIGTHFMNPVPLMSAVEVIKGFHTSKQTIEETTGLLSKLGKESIIVNDYPGFVSNRISHLLMNEAAFIVQDGVASAENVDKIFRKCYSHKMGPLETADLIGLDTVVKSLDVLYQSYQDPKFRCCPLLRKMADAGLHGKKAGQGFYKY